MSKTVKALFVTHNYGAYGASKSLQLLLKNNENLDISLIIPKKEHLTHDKRSQIANFYGIETVDIKQFFLPWNNCFEGRKTNFLNRSIQICKNLLWRFNKHQFYEFIKKGKFDLIHVNSIVLSDILSKNYPFIIHVRERVIYSAIRDLWNKIQKSRGVIFIDESVRMPFETIGLKNEMVLNNPVDMTGVGSYLKTAGNPVEDIVIISVIGRIEEGKGIDFIIRSFKKTSSKKLRLLIVGDEGEGMKTGYPRFCRQIASDDQRVLFWGHEPHIDKIYACSDYIIRGEIDFRMGRSILEGLYSDCDVIVPSQEREIFQRNRELRKFPQKVHPYHPRSIEDLARLFETIHDRKVNKKFFASNIEDYVQQYNQYIHRIFDLRPQPICRSKTYLEN